MNHTEKQLKIDRISGTVDFQDYMTIIQYGSVCHEKTKKHSDAVLQCIKGRDTGETGRIVTGLINEINCFPADSRKAGFMGMFGRKELSPRKLKEELAKVEMKVDILTGALYDQSNRMLKDTVLFQRMYDENSRNMEELALYIQAGKQKLAELPQNLPEGDDLKFARDAFEKKIYELELTHTLCVQMSAQIRMLQKNDMAMIDKIQALMKTTVPAWKNCISSAMGIDAVRKNNEALVSALDGVLHSEERGNSV